MRPLFRNLMVVGLCLATVAASSIKRAAYGSSLLAWAPSDSAGGTTQGLTAREVLNRTLAAMGGREALARVTTFVAEGEVEALGGFPGTYRKWAKAPNKMKTHWDIRYIDEERAFDGRAGWEQHAKARELVGRDLERLERSALFFPLLAYDAADLPVELGHDRLDGADVYVLTFTPRNGRPDAFYVDAQSFLPRQEVRQEPYEEGIVPLTISYDDYRSVDGITLPFAISEQRPDVALNIRIGEYRLNVPVDDKLFAHPLRARWDEPYEVSLSTIPRNVYKERDGTADDGWRRFWGIPFPPTESWLFNVVVNERYGRYMTPTAATLEFYAGSTRVKTVSIAADALHTLQTYPVTRYSPQEEIYDFRHHFSEPATLAIDRIVYTLEVTSRTGETSSASVEIPLSYYEQKVDFIFPIKGNFIATTGHEFYELGHKYEWSQHYSYDIVGLGPNFELARNDGATSADFYTFGTREILATADGVVVFARNDVPDGRVPREYLKMEDGLTAIGGNMLMIDHGTGEFSLFAHMRLGTVRVKKGDRVRQGDVLGLMGSSGSPGAPHVHYQLQADSALFGADGLPVRFSNVELVAWGRRGKVESPRRGAYMRAN